MTTAGTVTRGNRWAELHPPRRVLLLSESAGLGAMLTHMLGGTATLTRFDSLREAAERGGLDDADTVVLDLPREGANTMVAQLRHHYRGELIVLAERGQRRREAVSGPGWTQLTRPFSATDLGAALGVGAGVAARVARPRVPAAAEQPSPPAPAPTTDVKAAARRAPSWAWIATGQAVRDGFGGPVRRGLAALTHGWQARRRVRLAGFSAFALVAFAVAFILAATGRCGPGCDALGTGFSPKPTIAASDSSVPSTTGARRAPGTTGAPPVAGSPGAGAFGGVAGAGLATTTTEPRATTTSRKPGSGGGTPGSTTPATRPPTTPTTAPPTTAPPTTAPPTTAPPTTAPPVT